MPPNAPIRIKERKPLAAAALFPAMFFAGKLKARADEAAQTVEENRARRMAEFEEDLLGNRAVQRFRLTQRLHESAHERAVDMAYDERATTLQLNSLSHAAELIAKQIGVTFSEEEAERGLQEAWKRNPLRVKAGFAETIQPILDNPAHSTLEKCFLIQNLTPSPKASLTGRLGEIRQAIESLGLPAEEEAALFNRAVEKTLTGSGRAEQTLEARARELYGEFLPLYAGDRSLDEIWQMAEGAAILEQSKLAALRGRAPGAAQVAPSGEQPILGPLRALTPAKAAELMKEFRATYKDPFTTPGAKAAWDKFRHDNGYE